MPILDPKNCVASMSRVLVCDDTEGIGRPSLYMVVFGGDNITLGRRASQVAISKVLLNEGSSIFLGAQLVPNHAIATGTR